MATATVCSKSPPRKAWCAEEGATRSGGGQRAGRAAQLGTQLAIFQQALQQSFETGIEHLARKVLVEALQLLDVTMGDGQETCGILVCQLDPSDLLDRELQLLAKQLRTPAHPHELATLEAPGEEVGVAKDPAGEAAGLIAQLNREVGVA